MRKEIKLELSMENKTLINYLKFKDQQITLFGLKLQKRVMKLLLLKVS